MFYGCCFLDFVCESLAISKRCWCFANFELLYIRYLKIWARSWRSLIDIFVLIIVAISNICWNRPFLWENPRLSCWNGIILWIYFWLNQCAFSLIHCSDCFARKSNRRFVIIERIYTDYFIWTRPDIWSWFDIISSFSFGLRPWASSRFHCSYVCIVLPWAYSILFLSFVALNWRLV